MKPVPIMAFHVGVPLGQLRAAPVRLGGEQALLFVFSEDPSIDPFEEMFAFPAHTQKMALFTMQGREIWRRDFPGVVPGVWFFPVLPFDLDGDGCDEIFCVNNTDARRPLATSRLVLERLDPRSGKKTGEWPWPRPAHNQALSYKFRFFILGGYVRGVPVLVTAQGTYRQMRLQAWNTGLAPRWQLEFPDDGRGPRGSHTSAVLDLHADGRDKFMWGERCIEFDDGVQLFSADGDTWSEHSDIVQPVFNAADQSWYFFTCREKGDKGLVPRVVMFDQRGRRVWTDLDRGHIDLGWVASLGDNGEQFAMAARCQVDPATRKRSFEYWMYEAYTGKRIAIPFEQPEILRGRPLDFNGDGRHEIYYNGAIYDRRGRLRGSLGRVAGAATFYKLCDHPGEQILVYRPDGAIEAWGDAEARDTEQALRRYRSDYYRGNTRLSASGYNNLLTLTMF